MGVLSMIIKKLLCKLWLTVKHGILYVNPDRSSLASICQQVINSIYLIVINYIFIVKNLTAFKYKLF
jgi:hypothetical protein